MMFLDRERPDAKILTFNAKSTALLGEQQQDKEARLEDLD